MTSFEPRQLEEVLAQIPGVTIVRIAVDPGGVISEIHVLASTGRAAKQLVRDIQSVAIARFGIEVDYRKISIVQLEEDAVVENARSAIGGRPAVLRIASESEGNQVRTEVRLGIPGGEASGAAEGLASSGLRLVATAVLNALASLGGLSSAGVEFADIVPTAAGQVALVVVRASRERNEQVVSGSAFVRGGPQDAVARATLSAVNRLVEFPQ